MSQSVKSHRTFWTQITAAIRTSFSFRLWLPDYHRDPPPATLTKGRPLSFASGNRITADHAETLSHNLRGGMERPRATSATMAPPGRTRLTGILTNAVQERRAHWTRPRPIDFAFLPVPMSWATLISTS